MEKFKNILEKQMTMQGMTFNPSVDLRNDLINFHGYSKDDVLKMSDSEVFETIERINDINDYDEDYDVYNVIPMNCGKCNHKGIQEKDGYIDDYSLLYCPNCKHESHVHYTVMDGIYENSNI